MKFFKYIATSLTVILFASSMDAQIKVPAASPLATAEYTVGLTTVNIEYSRPSKNGRKIFGELVQYNSMWRTAANKNSMITFSDDVLIGGKEVKKGTYAIFTKPNKTAWDVYFYSDTENWGVPAQWDETKVVASVNVPVRNYSTTETFTINIGNLTNTSCDLEIIWDETLVAVRIDVPTDKKVTGNITQVMAGPSAGDYYNAARYYREAKKDLTQALAWMNKSIEMGNDKFWVLRQKSLIEADLGNYKAAIETAKKSLAMSQDANNADYVKMNTDSIAEWSKKK